jgi:multidrug efflux pump
VHALIGAAFARRSTVMLILLLALAGGIVSYLTIPKEAAPEVDIPLFTVSILYPGISAEDSARLLVRPMERQLQGTRGLRRMTAQSGDGFASIRLEFAAGGDHQRALTDVRDRVELGRADLPPGAEPPVVTQLDLALFPVVTAALSGPVSERNLVSLARALRDRIEALPGVLEVEIAGNRNDLMEVLVDPVAVESYGIAYADVAIAVDRNNRLIAAGAFDTGAGRIPLSIPGVVENIADVLTMPVLVEGGTVVTVGEVATVRQTFQDPVGYARLNGHPTIALEVRKAPGANIIDTVAAAQRIIDEEQSTWPAAISVSYLQNQATDIEDLLGDLENNVIAAILLVTMTVVLALGVRAALLVGIAIPGSFLAGVLAINLIGFTLNIVVLFSLILVIGMLVDGAIVVVELAERYLAEGSSRIDAYRRAAMRMAWPITASTATTLAVFVPLLFWPGVAGQFMSYLPATVLVTLLASLAMALMFVPVLGSLFGRGSAAVPTAAQAGRPGGLPSAAVGRYRRVIEDLIRHPWQALLGALALLFVTLAAYGTFGRGMEFFPRVEPQFLQVQIQTQGNLSVREADRLVRHVESLLLDVPEVATVYARTIGAVQARLGGDLPQDVIGTIRLDLVDWRRRDHADVLIDRLRARIGEIPGLVIQIREQERGPGGGFPIQVEIGSREPALIVATLDQVREMMERLGGFVDVTDDRPLAGVEVRLTVDREEAARYGTDVASLGTAVQLLTTGVRLGSYRPDFADEEVEIRLRFPPEDRTLAQLANLRISTPRGLVPIANFVSLQAAPATGLITRVDGTRVHRLSADAAPGSQVSERIAALQQAIDHAPIDPRVRVTFRGQAEDQAESGSFLLLAFVLAVALMLLILMAQFNSLFQALVVLSAIVFSTAGVLIGLMIRQEPFSLVMSGIGIIALAGIVVNNNIVLIDAYNEHRRAGLVPADAAALAAEQRLRPILLTAITTIVGLMPMVLALTIDFTARDAYFGAPSTQYWVQLSTGIVGGLVTATLITVLFTPSMLAWRDGRNRGSDNVSPRS